MVLRKKRWVNKGFSLFVSNGKLDTSVCRSSLPSWLTIGSSNLLQFYVIWYVGRQRASYVPFHLPLGTSFPCFSMDHRSAHRSQALARRPSAAQSVKTMEYLGGTRGSHRSGEVRRGALSRWRRVARREAGFQWIFPFLFKSRFSEPGYISIFNISVVGLKKISCELVNSKFGEGEFHFFICLKRP
jgi:hypothetical protein